MQLSSLLSAAAPLALLLLSAAAADEVPAVATIFGEEIHEQDPETVRSLILTRLFDAFAEEQGITVSDAEIDAFVESMVAGMRAEGLGAGDDLSPEEAEELAGMRREMGRAMIRQWKLNGALHERYGGRVIFQQLGPEPLDAYREFLEERRAAGDFEILDEAMAAHFWPYFTDDSRHSFYEPGSREEAEAFTRPPWERGGSGS